jgi:hypothetical protein
MFVAHLYLVVAIYVLRSKCERRDPGRSGEWEVEVEVESHPLLMR